MNRFKLTREEKAIEAALLRGDYVPASDAEVRRIAEALAARKKDAVLSIRVNRKDLAGFKKKARRLGVPYQSLLSELLHRFAGGPDLETAPHPPLSQRERE